MNGSFSPSSFLVLVAGRPVIALVVGARIVAIDLLKDVSLVDYYVGLGVVLYYSIDALRLALADGSAVPMSMEDGS